MPYIPQENRELIGAGCTPSNPGELNYVLTCVVKEYLSRTNGKYADFNAVIGVLECAKIELYRRMVAPYEDEMIEKNGDVL